MDLSTYTGLKEAVADWLMREDLTDQIPVFIALAEANLNRRVRAPEMVTRADTTISTQYFQGPLDLLEVRRLGLTDQVPPRSLEFMTVEQMTSEQYRYAKTGRPQHYTLQGRTIEVLPTPDQDYLAEMVYYASIPALSDSNTTNWLLTAHPDAYLYGALVESAPYLKEDERATVWGTLRDEAIRRINEEGQRAEYSRGPLRTRAKPL